MNGRLITGVLLIVLCAAGNRSAAQGKGEEKQETRNGKRGWLGVAIQDVTPRIAREKDLHVKSGALVNDVTEESPAEKAGIREDDVIVEFNGKSVEEADDLLAAVRSGSPGDKANLTFYRGQEKKSLQVTLGKAPRRNYAFSFHGPGNVRIPPLPRIRMFRSAGMLGLTLSDLNRQLGEYFEAPNGRGVLVEEVERKSAGDRAGFKAGDVIISVGTQEVESTEDVTEALEGAKKGEKVDFGILRKGVKTSLTVESEGPEGEGWNGFHSFKFHNDGIGIERNSLKREMEKVKEELRSIGTRIRMEMETLGRKLRSVTS
jgi:serine protease Do